MADAPISAVNWSASGAVPTPTDTVPVPLGPMAVVADADWVRWAVKIFGLAMPAVVRVFHNREIAEAKRWVSE